MPRDGVVWALGHAGPCCGGVIEEWAILGQD